jgi:hypothetical protein
MRILVAIALLGGLAFADEAKPKQPKKLVVAAGVSVPFYVYQSGSGQMPATHTTIDERVTLVNAVTVGYAVRPRVVLQAVGLFMNVVQSDAGKTGWVGGAVAPSALIRIWRGLSVSGGPLFWYRARFKYGNDVGAYYSIGYSFELTPELRLRLAFNSPQSYLNKTTVATSAGAALFYRF